MRYLVDANVLSEGTKPCPDANVVEWLRRNERLLVVDPIILGELRFGILLLAPGARRNRLEAWFDQGVSRIQCVPWDADTGRRWAELLASLRARGQAMPLKDSLIAATALSKNLILVTRNQRDFAATGVSTINPFAA